MKKNIFLASAATVIFVSAAGFAMGNTQDQDNRTSSATERAKQDYRAYLDQLKVLGAQYNQITGETKKIIKEEGVPVFDEATGQIKITHDLDFSERVQPVKESDDDIRITFEIPGVKKESLKVTVENDRMLHVKGIRKVENRDISINKSIELPASADTAKKPQASYEDGVLTVIVRKIQTPKKEIEIPVR